MFGDASVVLIFVTLYLFFDTHIMRRFHVLFFFKGIAIWNFETKLSRANFVFWARDNSLEKLQISKGCLHTEIKSYRDVIY